jgi:regulatory protein
MFTLIYNSSDDFNVMNEELNSRQLEAKAKTARFCAYQERSQKEVRNKLYDLGLYRDEVEEVISSLIIDNYINEERFAKAYAGGKFRMKKWGKKKILMGLRQYDISDYCVKKGLQEIDEEDYKTVLYDLIEKRNISTSDDNVFVKRNKIAKYLIGRGFESELVWNAIKDIIP